MTGSTLALAIILIAVVAGLALGWVLFLAIRPAWDATRPIPPVNETLQAERRWRAHNAAARAAGCPCGQPATEVRYDNRNTGSVPVETWTCADHVGAEMWSGNRPAWGHDRQLPGVECWGSSGPIGGKPNRWYHPVKPTEVAS
ncbi:hypothetical protein QQG74_09190 [Micromonospora sp. FIMYZ51]|uniref:hypothetical protein n=1 Tax=Micromonospora sp. FIMYZ51 TaxID=3051832 RepID=UPI00311EB94A